MNQGMEITAYTAKWVLFGKGKKRENKKKKKSERGRKRYGGHFILTFLL